jgi:hypothetical protein
MQAKRERLQKQDLKRRH